MDSGHHPVGPCGAPPADLDELRSKLHASADRIADAAQYAGNRHLRAGQTWARMYRVLGSLITAIAVVASLGATVAALSGRRPTLTALLSIASAGAIGMRVALRPDQRAEVHRASSRKYLALAADAIDFAEIDLSAGIDIKALVDRQDGLARRLHRFHADEPPSILPSRVVAAAEARHAIS